MMSKQYEKTWFYGGSIEVKKRLPSVAELAKLGTPPHDATIHTDQLQLSHSIVKEVSNDDNQVPGIDRENLSKRKREKTNTVKDKQA